MPLVDMKSDLSQINTNFGSGTTTAGKTTSFPYNKLQETPTPTTLYLDIKGDTASIFSNTNRAYPNVYNLGTNPTPLQTLETPNFPFPSGPPTNVSVDSFGAFTPISNAQNKFSVTYGNVSRLEQLHNSGRPNDFGFTRQGLSLDNYYAQAASDNGIFGQRNDRLDGDNQPYIVRNIGQRWGIDQTEIPEEVSTLGRIAINAGKELSADIFGRDITVFGDRYLSDIVRLSRFANPISTYVLKQSILQKRNTYDRVASQIYNPITIGNISLDNKSLDGFGDIAKFAIFNPQVYNPLSVFSAPGVPGLMFNRMGTDATDILGINTAAVQLGAQLAYNTAKVGLKAAGITAQYSARALSIAAPVAANVISSTIGGAGNMLIDFAKGATNPLAGLTNPLSGMTNPLAGLSNPLAGITNPLSGISNPLSGVTNPLAGISNPLAGIGNPFANVSVKGLAGKLPDLDLEAAKRAVTDVGKKIGRAAEKARDVAKDIIDDIGPIGKLKLMQLDPQAFGNIGIDKINLIPFGKQDYEGVSYDRLDWIPFKFVDLKENKPIVFRATLSSIVDSFSPEYASERYMGRPDNVYVYQGTNREISFNFDTYPSSAEELFIIWEKLNYLAGQTYPHWSEPSNGGGRGMISPMTSLTIGDMYTEAPGFISSLSYTVQDSGNWEVDIAKLPKYIQVACTFTYIGNRLPAATQKHFDLARIPEEVYETKKLQGALLEFGKEALKNPGQAVANAGSLISSDPSVKKQLLGKVGL